MMPVRDGLGCAERSKKLPETRDIPIIICSNPGRRRRGFSLGAADYLVKPFLQEI